MLLLLLLSRFSCFQLCDPIDGSSPGTPVPGILQARRVEWVAISFSNAWKWKVKSESEVAQSCPTLSDPMDCSLTGSSVHGFSRQEYWSGLPMPSPLFFIFCKCCYFISSKFSLALQNYSLEVITFILPSIWFSIQSFYRLSPKFKIESYKLMKEIRII